MSSSSGCLDAAIDVTEGARRSCGGGDRSVPPRPERPWPVESPGHFAKQVPPLCRDDQSRPECGGWRETRYGLPAPARRERARQISDRHAGGRKLVERPLFGGRRTIPFLPAKGGAEAVLAQCRVQRRDRLLPHERSPRRRRGAGYQRRSATGPCAANGSARRRTTEGPGGQRRRSPRVGGSASLPGPSDDRTRPRGEGDHLPPVHRSASAAPAAAIAASAATIAALAACPAAPTRRRRHSVGDRTVCAPWTPRPPMQRAISTQPRIVAAVGSGGPKADVTRPALRRFRPSAWTAA